MDILIGLSMEENNYLKLREELSNIIEISILNTLIWYETLMLNFRNLSKRY